jgi:hypothetical protein
MDTKEIELKQGATADLLQQKPHVQVVDSKTSAASSDEERLAAGISTIGMQTKRLSGTQRKKLITEIKMEGTWTVEKPPRKTLPSQVKGTAGSSGGVKRPHSDSSTPSLKKQQPKNPRNTQVQTETYKEAVTGIKIANIHRHHPEATLDQTQINIIQAKLKTALDANPSGRFLHNSYIRNLHREYFGSPVQMNP